LFDVFRDASHPVEQGIFGVQVQVSEIGQVRLCSSAALAAIPARMG
jgi:hypothetical protein